MSPGKPEVAQVLRMLDWMRAERIWPNGPRYDRNAVTHVMACSPCFRGS